MTIRGVGLANLANGRWKDQSSADEMATMFLEAAPTSARATTHPWTSATRPASRPPEILEGSLGARSSASAPGAGRLRARLRACVPAPVDDVDWSALRAVVPSEAASDVGRPTLASPSSANSGGAVFFCVFAPGRHPARHRLGTRPRAHPGGEVLRQPPRRAVGVLRARRLRAAGVVVPASDLLRKTAAPSRRPVDCTHPRSTRRPPRQTLLGTLLSWAAAKRAVVKKPLFSVGGVQAARIPFRADASPKRRPVRFRVGGGVVRVISR